LVPVKPLVELNMSDPRFITSADVLSTLDQRPNLMELTPSEFENLITNLFESMGLETRLTQASRDGGVDWVAYGWERNFRKACFPTNFSPPR
jgi:restriction system protein